MGRRASAFAAQLDDLDDLDNLPGLPARPAPTVAAAAAGETADGPDTAAGSLDAAQAPKAGPRPGVPRKRTQTDIAPRPAGGTRATQVRLPPELARWLSGQAQSTGRTLASVVALAAKAHQGALPLDPAPVDELDVSRRTAAATVPVTLRLNGAQRELLDDLAGQHTTTRSAIIVAALTASRTTPAAPDTKTDAETDGGREQAGQ